MVFGGRAEGTCYTPLIPENTQGRWTKGKNISFLIVSLGWGGGNELGTPAPLPHLLGLWGETDLKAGL